MRSEHAFIPSFSQRARTMQRKRKRKKESERDLEEKEKFLLPCSW